MRLFVHVVRKQNEFVVLPIGQPRQILVQIDHKRCNLITKPTRERDIHVLHEQYTKEVDTLSVS